MTDRQAAILSCVEQHIATRGFAPSLREIMEACGVSSTSVAAYNLRRLVQYGCLETTPGIARSLTLGSRAPLIEDLRGAVGLLEDKRADDALMTLRGLLKRLEGYV
jgi:repressor LexA